MFDFDGDGDFDAFDEFIEYSILFDTNATCPSCSGTFSPASQGVTTCPNCNATIRVE